MNRETMELIDACLEGSIGKEEFQHLQRILKDDPRAREHWLRQAGTHGQLEWELSGQSNNATTPFPATPRFSKPKAAWFAAAALLALGIGLGWNIPRQRATTTTVRNSDDLSRFELVARITSEKGARWKTAGLRTGSWLNPGILELESGSAMVTFDSGAGIQINGPCRFRVDTRTRALLEDGEAVATIPEQATGFVLETPSTQLSRRNSRFIVRVAGGQSEIEVLEGEIQIAGKAGDFDTMALARDQAVRIGGSGEILPATDVRSSHPAALPAASDELLPGWFLHWSFDSADPSRGEFKETGDHPGMANNYPAQAREALPDAMVSLVPGRFGNAVKLNGQQAFLATEYPGISGNAPRTVSMWVRVEPQTPDTLAYSFLSWGKADNFRGGKWQLAWNPGKDNSGTVGALRTEVDGGFVVGSTNLRTGKWHHIAVVFTGGENADVATHARQYVDGRLESDTAFKSKKVDTITRGKDALPLMVGRRLEGAGYFRNFRGEIDEVYLFPVPLTPGQIELLYQTNTPPPLNTLADANGH